MNVRGFELVAVNHMECAASSAQTHQLVRRVFEVNQNHRADALALLQEVEQMLAPSVVNLIGLVPVTGDNMITMTVSYQLRSIGHWGEVMDTVGTSTEFPSIIARVAEYGMLRMSSALVPL